MSFSDFFIIPSSDNQASPPTGSAYLNSSIAPYTTAITSSDLCRAFNGDGNENQETKANFFISSSYLSGQCVDIADTKSVSIRLWGRNYSYSGQGRVVLNAKHSPYNSYYNSSDNSTNSKSGYEFSYSTGVDGGSGASFYRYDFVAGGYSANMTETMISRTFVFPPNDFSVPWVGLRMDLLPVKVLTLIDGVSQYLLSKDIVILYTANVSDPTNWTEIYKTEILTSDSRFVPWGNYTSLSNGQDRAGNPVLTSSYGFSIRQQSYSFSRTYIDDFQMYVKDAF
jgi:hypothetical protein